MSKAKKAILKQNPQNAEKVSLIAGMSSMVVFAVLACIVLLVCNYNYLQKIEDLSIFMSGSEWFSECMRRPAGLLTWFATFLTQFLYYPWLGATVLIVLLLMLWWLIYRSFALPRTLFPLAGVVPALLLLTVLTPGYLIFLMKTPGFVFSGVLGVALAVAVYGLYRRLTGRFYRALVLVAVVLAYPLFGFYSLLAAGLCLLHELVADRCLWLMALAVVLAAAVPQLYFYFGDAHVMQSRIYIAGLPRYGAESSALWWPWIACFCLLALQALGGRALGNLGKKGLGALAAGCLLPAAAMVALVLCSYRDANFNVYLKMDRAVQDGDYAAALAAARSLKEEPTRVTGLYTHLALQRMNLAGDSLFTFPFAAAEYASPRPDMALLTTCSRSINFGFGRINDCYRWCMEDMVEYGPRVDYLKYMSKCALLNGEYDLARRYLRKLSRTMFHKDWAERYMAYADNPESMDSDPELSKMRPLMAHGNYIGGDGALVESYLSASLAGMAGGPPELLELSLQFNLIRKSIQDFWPRFLPYARSHERLPVHYQEAALLFSTLEGKIDWRNFKIDPAVATRFETFMKMAKANGHNSKDTNRELFRPYFGDTYWYYYFFTTGLKTK